MQALYRQQGAQMDITILAEDEVQQFIDTHAEALNGSFSQVKMSDTMRQRLERSNWVFSGMKTFHELNESFPSLLDENGDRKPFERFLNDVRAVDETYNGNYLRAEYNFIHASASMAAKWEQYQEDGDRYYLQYRTAGDDRVRPEHAALEGVTLPMDDPFWEEYYPPNGWNCRCTVVQVRKSKYPKTDHDEAMRLGELATGQDTRGMFHFNPGKQQKAVPDYNPYTIRQCRQCPTAKGDGKENLAAFIPQNDLCQACQTVRSIHDKKDRENIMDEKKRRLDRFVTFETESKNLQTGKFYQTKSAYKRGIAHAYNIEELNMYEWIPRNLDKLEFIRFSPLGEVKDMTSEKDIKNIENKRKRHVTGYNVYKLIDGDTEWQVKMEIYRDKNETVYHVMKKRR